MENDIESSDSRIPTRAGAASFYLKASGLRLKRGLKNLVGPGRLPGAQHFPPSIIAESRSPLWTSESLVERSLQLGKIQNLRLATRHLNGTLIKVGQEFSFWTQLGRATESRGYVPGRELREGCLIPAIGGGICQLSNAIYDLALQAGCKITERHAHSRVIPGSAAERGRDATVAWNYIDLRFIPEQDLVLELKLSQSQLIARFRSSGPPKSRTTPSSATLSVIQNPSLDQLAHTCTDCGAEACFRHIVPRSSYASTRTAFLLDENWPEYIEYVSSERQQRDVVGVPLNGEFLRQSRYTWPTAGFDRVATANRFAISRGLAMRRAATVPGRIAAQMSGTRRIAERLAKQIPFDVERVVLAQSFLPYLWSSGHLSARKFSVLMTRLPLSVLHARLDQAFRKNPERTTLAEYRAPAELADAEAVALEAAERIITPHREIAGLFPAKTHLLDWSTKHSGGSATGNKIIFPGPTAARKGAYELREAARKLNLELVLLGNELEGRDFWQGIRVARAEGDWIKDAAVVVQPALVEDNPRSLLAALAHCIPVIATSACGLPSAPNVHFVSFGNAGELQQAIQNVLSLRD